MCQSPVDLLATEINTLTPLLYNKLGRGYTIQVFNERRCQLSVTTDHPSTNRRNEYLFRR